MEVFRDSFALAADAQDIVGRLIAEKPQFAHLVDARIVCIHSEMGVKHHGADARAVIGPQPRLQGVFANLLRWLFDGFVSEVAGPEGAEFFVVIDAAVWRGLDATRRERLMFHELKHVVALEDDNGVPKLNGDGTLKLTTVPHDYEFFDDELREYGHIVCDLDALPAAVIAGGQRDRERGRRGLRRVV